MKKFRTKIEFCGNYLAEVSEASRRLWELNQSYKTQVSHINKPKVVKQLEAKILRPHAPANRLCYSSSFQRSGISIQCRAWHVDQFQGMVICSHPTPVEILDCEYITKQELLVLIGATDGGIVDTCNGRLSEKDRLIDEIVQSGRGRFFVPNQGDIYRLHGPVPHRTNPASDGKHHTCLRIWYGEAIHVVPKEIQKYKESFGTFRRDNTLGIGKGAKRI